MKIVFFLSFVFSFTFFSFLFCFLSISFGISSFIIIVNSTYCATKCATKCGIVIRYNGVWRANQELVGIRNTQKSLSKYTTDQQVGKQYPVNTTYNSGCVKNPIQTFSNFKKVYFSYYLSRYFYNITAPILYLSSAFFHFSSHGIIWSDKSFLCFFCLTLIFSILWLMIWVEIPQALQLQFFHFKIPSQRPK